MPLQPRKAENDRECAPKASAASHKVATIPLCTMLAAMGEIEASSAPSAHATMQLKL